MDNKIIKITDFELDQLKEVINIGISHSSTALSKMLDKKVVITVPEVIADEIDNISKIIGGEKEIATAILLRIRGDAPGLMTFIFPNKKGTDINKMINLITKRDEIKDNVNIDEFDVSVLKEVGNILSGASLTAFSKFLNIEMVQSVSVAVTDMLGSIVNSIMAEISKTANTALLFKVVFDIKDEPIKPELFFFIDPRSTNRILKATKKILGV